MLYLECANLYIRKKEKSHRGSSEKKERRHMALKNARKSMLFDDLPSSERILKKDQRMQEMGVERQSFRENRLKM